MPGIGAPMLTSGRKISSARRERPMAMPMVTPTTAASAKPASSRKSVSSAWCGRMPLAVSRPKAAAMSPRVGNRRGGNSAGARDDLPQEPDDQERVGGAGDRAPARLAHVGRPERQRRGGGQGGDILHGNPDELVRRGQSDDRAVGPGSTSACGRSLPGTVTAGEAPPLIHH